MTVGQAGSGTPESDPLGPGDDDPGASAPAGGTGVPASERPADETPADGDGPEEDEGDDKPSQIAVNEWQFFGLVAVLIALLAVLIAGFAFKGSTDSVTGIIGAALPPFATIAAAIFGVKAVYDSGKATGEATGKAEGEANKDEAVKEAQDRAAKAISAPLRRAQTGGVRELVGQLRWAGESPRGSQELHLLGPDPSEFVVLPSELLESAEQPGREVEVALAIAEQYMRRPPRNRARR